jgi:hypothetical protein
MQWLILNITAHIIDDQSGMKGAQVWLRSPTSKQFAAVQLTPMSRIYGTSRDGVYVADLVLPIDNEKGVWHINNITLMDIEGNQRVLHVADLNHIGLISSCSIN